MIKIDRGDCELNGTALDLMSELTLIIKHVYRDVLIPTGGEEWAGEALAEIGKLAVAGESDWIKKLKECVDNEHHI